MSLQMTQRSLTRMSKRTWDPKTSNFSSKSLWPDQHDNIARMHSFKPLKGNISERLSCSREAFTVWLPGQSLERDQACSKPYLIGFSENVDIERKVQPKHVEISKLCLLFEVGMEARRFYLKHELCSTSLIKKWCLSPLPSHLLHSDNYVYRSKRFPLHNASNHRLNNAASHTGQH